MIRFNPSHPSTQPSEPFPIPIPPTTRLPQMLLVPILGRSCLLRASYSHLFAWSPRNSRPGSTETFLHSFAQVAAHSSPDDCWVSFHGSVYDLTKLVSENEGPVVQPLIKVAGSDISHWFDAVFLQALAGEKAQKDINIKMHVDPVTNLRRPYVPMGRFLHVAPAEPVGDWDTSSSTPWWKDGALKIGKLSLTMRKIRVKSVLTGQEHLMEVPSEETIAEIRERYLEYNWHAASYTWKVLRKEEGGGDFGFLDLDLNKTLEENGVADEAADFEELAIPSDFAIPVIHLYFTDDLTVA